MLKKNKMLGRVRAWWWCVLGGAWVVVWAGWWCWCMGGSVGGVVTDSCLASFLPACGLRGEGGGWLRRSWYPNKSRRIFPFISPITCPLPCACAPRGSSFPTLESPAWEGRGGVVVGAITDEDMKNWNVIIVPLACPFPVCPCCYGDDSLTCRKEGGEGRGWGAGR